MSHLLCEVEKLLADEEPTVRGVALETLSDIVPLIDDESEYNNHKRNFFAIRCCCIIIFTLCPDGDFCACNFLILK